jgi:hypothetical protein
MNTHQQPQQSQLTTASLTVYLALSLLIIGLYAFVASSSSYPVAAAGTHWYVAPTGADSNDCLSPATACQSIHTAITKATESATIHIAAGTYYENLTITKTLTLIGERADLTHVDGSQRGRVFYVNATQPVTLSQITIQQGDAGQESGGGITAYTDVTLIDVIVRDNRAFSGGGIAVRKPALLTARNAAILNNAALNDAIFSDGGGVLVTGGSSSASLTNVTMSGNHAAGTGGGMRAEGYLELTNITIADNTAADAAGIWMRASTTIITNTLIANNNGPNCASAIGPLQVEGSNLATDTTCGFTAPSDTITNNPGLDALRDNGGHTLTHGLLAGSPAIDNADSSACPSTDQRGVARPQSSGSTLAARCDIGAYELAPVQEAPTATPTTTATPMLHNTETPTLTSTPTTESHANDYFLPLIIEH